MRRILVTGFGPFSGAPVNPTEALVRSLSRARMPAIQIHSHVFRTSYVSVDRELPALLFRLRPHALLMFGLAAETPHLRIETRARNVLSPLADADGVIATAPAIAPGRGPVLPLPTPARALSAAARRAGTPAAISNDAGDYLCNYLCWSAALAARRPAGPRLAAFIHVPEGFDGDDLARAALAFLAAMVGAARR